MKAVFADTSFWIAVVNKDDALHQKALQLLPLFTQSNVVTTDEVLVEFLTYFANKGPHNRLRAINMARDLIQYDTVEVITQTRDSLLAGMSLYENRLDKEYSLTDCISMQTMKAMAIQEVLTLDHHFTQEGFKRLMN